MSELEARIDPWRLVQWLGKDGAKAGLKASKSCTVSTLMDAASRLGIKAESKATRQELIDEIVRVAGRRIDKTIDDLQRMSREELVHYFERVGADHEELLDLLREMNVQPTKEALRNLVEFVSMELSETGRFIRIAGKKSNVG